MSQIAPNLGVERYGNLGGAVLPSRVTEREPPTAFLCGSCKRLIQTEPVHLHLPARRQAIEGSKSCAICPSTFHPSRSDRKYCSKACRDKGFRLGKAKVAERMESDAWMQRCRFPGCTNTLVGRTARARYCSDACKMRAHRGRARE